MKLPESVRTIIQALSELPGIGPRQATRLAFYLLSQGHGTINNLAGALEEMKLLNICTRCYFIHKNEGGLCETCANSNRDQSVILIIEKETDLLSLENTNRYSGRYFILGEMPKTGLLEGWQKARIENLKKFIREDLGGQAKEIILGFNPTSVGDFHAATIGKELGPFTQKISRLGRGLPTGGEIEFADDETLGASLERRS